MAKSKLANLANPKWTPLTYDDTFDPIIKVSHKINFTLQSFGDVLFANAVVVVGHDRGDAATRATLATISILFESFVVSIVGADSFPVLTTVVATVGIGHCLTQKEREREKKL